MIGNGMDHGVNVMDNWLGIVWLVMVCNVVAHWLGLVWLMMVMSWLIG